MLLYEMRCTEHTHVFKTGSSNQFWIISKSSVHLKRNPQKNHPKPHYKSKRQIEIPDYKSILNNWGLSFNFMNWGRTKSFSFCANSVFHPWWWLLVLGIKCWEFLLQTRLWHLWPWMKSQKPSVSCFFGGGWGVRRRFLGSFGWEFP